MRHTLAFVSATAVLCSYVWGTQVARADSTEPTVDVQLFHPTPGPTGFFTTESGEVNGHLGMTFGASLNYARKPLEVRIIQEDGPADPIGAVVSNRADLNLLASIGLFGVAELGIAVPLIAQGGLDQDNFEGADIDVGADALKMFTQGDIRLVPKVRLLRLDEGVFAAALIPTVIVPSAAGTPYAGEANVVVAPSLALSSRMPLVRMAVDVGYRFRDRTKVATLIVDDEVFYKAAMGVDTSFGGETPVEIIAEVFGHTAANNPFNLQSKGIKRDFQRARTSLELQVGVRTVLMQSLILTAGIGGGLMPGYGAPAPRVFAGLGFFTGEGPVPDMDDDGVPDEVDACIDKAEDKDDFEDEDGCPDIDNDNDKVLDEDDGCPMEPEDRDRHMDEDGCPEPDNDEDGLLDTDDQCPNEPEDKDEFQDEDGCPDPDNDGDSILDTADECPTEPEDVDGFRDEDGCPEPDNDGDGLTDLNDLCPNFAEDMDNVADDDGCPEDNDGDGIADEEDQCPNKAETYNGIDDSDGCPEKLRVKSLVRVTEEKIEIKEKVYFTSGSTRIQKRSFKLLDQVASVMANYKHITKVQVEGHTDSRGRRSRNKALSQDRAQAVVDYLVGKGIDPTRLEAIGYGSEKPMTSNKTARGREANRRVEFVIAEQKPYGKDVAEPVVEMEMDLPATEEAPASEGLLDGVLDGALDDATPPPPDGGGDMDFGGDLLDIGADGEAPLEPEPPSEEKPAEDGASEPSAEDAAPAPDLEEAPPERKRGKKRRGKKKRRKKKKEEAPPEDDIQIEFDF